MAVQQLFLISALVPIVTVLVLLRHVEPLGLRLTGAPALLRRTDPRGLRLTEPLVLLRHAGPRLQSVSYTAEFRAGEPRTPVAPNRRQGWQPSSNNRPPRLCSS